jgi:diamine N-acetyltransferase
VMTAARSSDKPMRLVPIDDQNRAAVLALQVRRDQIQLVAPNSKSLRQASQDPSLVPFAFLEGDLVVGFAMYQRRRDGSAYIWRVMIGDAYQGQGLGRRLMELLMEELRGEGFREFMISHRPQNRVAAILFESFGFFEEDFEADGEVIRRLHLPPESGPAGLGE